MTFKYKKLLTYILTIALFLTSVGLPSVSANAEEVSTEIVEGLELPEDPLITDTDTEEVPDDTQTDTPEVQDPEAPDSEFNETSENTTDDETETIVDQETETDDSEEETEEEDDEESAEEEDPYTISKTIKVSLKYDDRYTFDSSFSKYTLFETKNEEITSYTVSGGAVQEKKDTKLLTPKNNSKLNYTATAVGSGDLIFVKEEDAKRLNDPEAENTEKVSAIQVHVTVAPAVLTIMYLAGQSNMEGVCGNMNFKPKNSIACTDGTVYSTHGYKSSDRGANLTGLSITNEMSGENTADFVPESLTSNKSLSGVTLQYPLNSLTSEGNGKTGPDSGIAYEWNRLTGDKVWTINASYGGSAIERWSENNNCYLRAYKLFKNAQKVYTAEISAGHYTSSRQLFFWMQGEANTTSTVASYRENFLSMYNGFQSLCEFSHFGIITTRCSDDHKTKKSIAMASPRITQYYVGGVNGLNNVYIVSNENEKWISDTGVKNYFTTRYPSGSFTYPKRKGNSLKELPVKLNDVHPDIHYSQEAHNENGINAARGMYKIIYGKTKSTTPSVAWIDQNGDTITSKTVTANEKFIIVPRIYPGYCAKDVTLELPSGVTYTDQTGYMNFKSSGTKNIYVKDSNGKTISTLTVTAETLSAPKVTSLQSALGGVSIKWNKVSGASKYRVYRKKEGGSWEKLEDTTSTSYLDTTAVSGVTYSYTVRCLNKDGNGFTSSYDTTGWKINYLATPEVTSIKNASSGIKLVWKTVKQATGYKIYRKTGNNSYQKIITIKDASATSFIDQGALHGSLYEYKVLAYNAETKSGSATPYPKMYRLKEPVITSLTNSAAGKVVLKHATDAYVTGYQCYYIDPVNGNKVTKTVSDKTTSTLTTTNLKKGKTYTFYFRTFKKSDGVNYYSVWSKGVSIKVTK